MAIIFNVCHQTMPYALNIYYLGNKNTYRNKNSSF
ncbi:rCG22841 [Rattus norvegicus]|uniref:RCG22841 n=1 Tax=Rattus norvegicus TaxID=10116 RepID=A6KP49_RAT|nr:rCG22841 [Rattus norvegicus]